MSDFDTARERIRECRDSQADSLDLSGLNFSHLPEEIQEVTKITRLDLRGNSRLSNLDSLKGLESLIELDVSSCQNLKDLGGLESLKSITELTISNNPHLTKLDGLEGLENLKVLTAYFCKNLRDVGALAHLKRLRQPYFQYCGIESFPRFLLSADILVLTRNPINDFPVELLSNSPSYNCLPAVRDYFDECAKGSTDNKMRKWLFLGNGRTGKTTLIRILKGEKPDENEETTHGIDIVEVTVDETEYRFWDFGGQDIYLATHQMFMRSVDGVVLCYRRGSNESGTQDDGLGNLWENRTLSYWVEMIKTNAPNARVLPVEIVPNRDNVADRQDPWDRAKQRLEPASRLDKISIENVFENEAVIPYVRESVSSRLKLSRESKYPLPISWVKTVKDLVEKRKERKLISYEEYTESTRGMAGKTLLRYLHGSGEVFYDSSLFQGKIVLNQQWILNSIYALFERKTWAAAIRQNGGRFYALQGSLVWPDNTEEEHRLFISMMESCAVLFELTPRGSEFKDRIFLIPELMSDKDTRWENLFEHHDGEAWEGEYQLPFLHRGVVNAWLSHAGSRWGDSVFYFRNGVGLYRGGAPVKVEFWLHEGEDGERGRISITGKGGGGSDFQEFLQALLTNLEEYLERAGIRDYTSPKFLWRTEQRGMEEESYLSQQDEGGEKADLPPMEKQDSKRRLFVAYAEEQKEILETVSKHINAYSGAHSPPSIELHHDRVIKEGEAWKSRIPAEIRRADGILFLLSKDYLAKKFCQEEIRIAKEKKKERPSYQIFPLPLEHCSWKEYLSDYQSCLGKEGTPLLEIECDPDRNELLMNTINSTLATFLGELAETNRPL